MVQRAAYQVWIVIAHRKEAIGFMHMDRKSRGFDLRDSIYE